MQRAPSHYFSSQPDSPGETLVFPLRFGGRTFQWTSAPGVFSRDHFDFGSRVLLESAVLPPTGRLLDLGCGTGPLGLLAALAAPGLWVCLSDVNARALDCARRNRDALGLQGRASVVRASFVEALRPSSFDVVLFNPPVRVGKAAVYSALERVVGVLAAAGQLYCVVRVQQGARSMLVHLQEVFEGRASILERRKGYLVLRALARPADNMAAAHPEVRAAACSLPTAADHPEETGK